MVKRLEVRDHTEISAPHAIVWKLLTENPYISEYMHECEIQSDWQVGGSVLWKNKNDRSIILKGILVQLELQKLLHYSVFDPHLCDYADVPTNYSDVTIAVDDIHGSTLLSVVHGGFEHIVNGGALFKQETDRWHFTLSRIKQLAENFQE